MKSQIQPADAIIVTFGKKIFDGNGGKEKFIEFFESWAQRENCEWYHKCKNRPHQDIAWVYVIVENFIMYRMFYGGYKSVGEKILTWEDGVKEISWPRIILAGPLTKAPTQMPMRGFQGFRYTQKLF